MYKVEISLGWLDNEKIVIETNDWTKIAAIQDFVDYQESIDWEMDEDEGEEVELSFDEDGTAWYEDGDGSWYYYDEESECFIEYLEEEEDEVEEE